MDHKELLPAGSGSHNEPLLPVHETSDARELGASAQLTERTREAERSLFTTFSLSLAALFIAFVLALAWAWPFSPTSLLREVGWEASLKQQYVLGTGKADITGPIVEINFMGYANSSQVGTGLRQRLFSRAFIVGDPLWPADRFVYLVLDTQSGDTAVRYGILDALKQLSAEYRVYGQHNVAVTGTHSHSGPGGWLNYLLPQITSKGFDHQSFQAIVNGAVLSLRAAHESLQPGYLTLGSTKVFGANINRSLFAYLANPEEERQRYNASATDDGSVEKDLTMLKFQRASDGKSIGVLTWFPTHGTSMLGNNTLVTGDNKGVAAWLFEESMKHDASAADDFVAGFSQSSVGDVSPNVLGAWCEDGSGAMCSLENSTCADGKSQHCHARGPFFGRDDAGTASCYEIGRRQFQPARDLYDQLAMAPTYVEGGPVRSFHKFQNMSGFRFTLPNGTLAQTCPAALGYSFAAGTTDGPGIFSFTQHDKDATNDPPIWRLVSRLLKNASDAQRACHGSKPILLDVGEITTPYQWTPNIVDLQVLRVGQLIIVVSAGEATTMAGRRWKGAVRDAAAALLQDEGSPVVEPVVVLGGPANSYTHYITTEPEYGVQRYEGASTLYGPHTLQAYINVTLKHLPRLGASSSSGPSLHTTGGHHGRDHGHEHEYEHGYDDGGDDDDDDDDDDHWPPNNVNRSLSFVSPVLLDSPGLFRSFGDVVSDVSPYYRRGRDVVRCTFVGANPRNNLRLGGTFLSVEKLTIRNGREVWAVARTDADWSTVLRWRRTSEVLGTSEVELVWEAEEDAEVGPYRLRYSGDARSLGGTITAFSGVSGIFTLIS
jgi:neutral ceramidase